MSEAQVLYGAVLGAMRALHAAQDAFVNVMADGAVTAEDEEQLTWLASASLSKDLFGSASMRKVRRTIAYLKRRVAEESWTEFMPDIHCQSGGYDRPRITPLGQVLDGFCDAMTLLDTCLVEVR
ncbi:MULTISPECIES: hypothetical protein [unclassified Marinovum]